MRQTLMAVKKDAEQYNELTRKHGWKENHAMQTIESRVEAEEKYLFKRMLELEDLKRGKSKNQTILMGEMQR